MRQDTESEAGYRHWAVSTEPDAGLELTNHEIMTWAEVGCLINWATQAPPKLVFKDIREVEISQNKSRQGQSNFLLWWVPEVIDHRAVTDCLLANRIFSRDFNNLCHDILVGKMRKMGWMIVPSRGRVTCWMTGVNLCHFICPLSVESLILE